MWELASFDVRVVLRNLGLQTLVSMALGGLKNLAFGASSCRVGMSPGFTIHG